MNIDKLPLKRTNHQAHIRNQHKYPSKDLDDSDSTSKKTGATGPKHFKQIPKGRKGDFMESKRQSISMT
jgi:hypothetical protein